MAAVALPGGCGSEPVESEGSITFGGQSFFILPPGEHNTFMDGETFVISLFPESPYVHAANCFSGVPDPGDFGIGTSVGAAQDFIGTAVLPVNINLGNTVLDSYTIRIESSHSSVTFDTNVTGSKPVLASGTCTQRGCPSNCGDYPGLYPPQFDPATGFEDPPTVTGGATAITVQATDSDTADVTGTVNLCNVRVNISDDMPSAGVELIFTVKSLSARGGVITAFPISGRVVENYRFE